MLPLLQPQHAAIRLKIDNHNLLKRLFSTHTACRLRQYHHKVYHYKLLKT